MIDGIINESKDVPRHKVDAGDDQHPPIYELAKVVALHILLNCFVKLREVLEEACQVLIPDDILIPLVKGPHCSPIAPAVAIPAEVWGMYR